MSKKNILWALTFLLSETTLAQSGATGPWSTRFFGQGLIGDSRQLAGFFDGMLPLAGTNDSLWYLDGSFLSGQGGNQAGSLGSGLRALKTWNGHEVIAGGFLFAEYQQNANQTNRWIANPGIELLTSNHELRIQGYLPIGSRSQIYKYTMASMIPQAVLNDSGQSTTTVFKPTVHSLIDTPVTLNNEFGRGIEAEVGQYVPFYKGGWLRAGLYHFNYPNTPGINGVEANYEFFVSKNTSLVVQDNYDNQNKNKFSLGLRVRFGGPDTLNVNQLRNRMEEPIIRHLARQSYGMATPVRDSFSVNGPAQIVRDNLWFFSPYGTAQGPVSFFSCTAENPCVNLNQEISTGINAISPNATLWFATGNYQLPSQTSKPPTLLAASSNSHYVAMATGQAIIGRTLDFRQAAQGTSRPQITGALFWNGAGQISNMQVNNKNQVLTNQLTGSSQDAVIALGGQSLTVNNSVINASDNRVSNGSNVIAVFSKNAVALIDSTVNATGRVKVTAVQSLNSTASLNNSLVKAQGQDNTVGIRAKTNIDLTHSTISADGGAGTSTYSVLSFKDTTLTDSIINATGRGRTIAGVQANGGITATKSIINATNTNSGNSIVYGLSSVTYALANQSTVTATGYSAHGVNATNSKISDSQITVNATHDGGGVEGYVDGINTGKSEIVTSLISVDNTGVGSANGVFGENQAVVSGGSTINITSSGTGSSSSGVISFRTALINDGSIININSSGTGASAFGVTSSGTALVNGSEINVTGGLIAVGVDSTNQATVIGSKVHVLTNQLDSTANGVNSNAGTAIASQSNIDVTASIALGVVGLNQATLKDVSNLNITSNQLDGNAFGVYSSAGTGLVSGSTINGTGSTVRGIYTQQLATVMAASNINVTATTQAIGVFSPSNVNVNHSTVTAKGLGQFTTYAVYGQNSATVADSTITTTSTGSNSSAYGVRGGNVLGSAIVSGSVVTATGLGPLTYGVYGASRTTVNGNSHISAIGSGTGVTYGVRGGALGISIVDSIINGVASGTGTVGGVLANLAHSTVNISNSSIAATQRNGRSALGVNFSSGTGTIVFQGTPASVVKADTTGTATAISGSTSVTNNSTPQSLCKINDVETICA